MNEKCRGLLADLAVYAAAFGVGLIPFLLIDDMFAATAAFTAAATAVIFLFSTFLRDVSVYDPYWSVAPPVMIAADMIRYRLWTVNAYILLFLVVLWSFRLTANWFVTYKGLRHEDWRYAQFREKYKTPLFLFISFTGLHFIPTIVVYGGLTSVLFALPEERFAPLSLVGIAVSLCAILLEFVSDRAIHRFLREHGKERRTCGLSVWGFSRHPNYLGEMSFWTGLYLYFLFLRPDIWFMGLGFLSIIALFLLVSIPMMEKHNSERRADYEEYKKRTSMLLLLPKKK